MGVGKMNKCNHVYGSYSWYDCDDAIMGGDCVRISILTEEQKASIISGMSMITLEDIESRNKYCPDCGKKINWKDMENIIKIMNSRIR